MIYLDNAATTKIAPEALDAMLQFLGQDYGNPGSIHCMGKCAQKAVDESRNKVARFINAPYDSIIFTSSGSEANSTAIKGTEKFRRMSGREGIVVSAYEHDSVINAASMYDDLYFACVDSNGIVTPAALEDAISCNTGIVSVMRVNNELGTVNDVRALAEIAHKYGALFHTDCVQAAASMPIDVAALGCDMASISSHKIHGPKGAGALYIKDKAMLQPIINGGSAQEFGYRGGTENVPCIVGFGIACERAMRYMEWRQKRISMLKHAFMTNLTSVLECSGHLSNMIRANCGSDESESSIISLTIKGIDAETLVLAMSSDGVCISSGAACRSNESSPSYVLTSAGITADEARSTVRISLSDTTSNDDILCASYRMGKIISKLLGLCG